MSLHWSDQCKDMFRGVIAVTKQIKKEITETEQKEKQKEEATERK